MLPSIIWKAKNSLERGSVRKHFVRQSKNCCKRISKFKIPNQMKHMVESAIGAADATTEPYVLYIV